ncbi:MULTISPECIES: hypothetical protein [Sphingobacterium]|uniref:hypothetical protein n=1 Tax=Sphingobacterium TaxID=28453 RepID=UPI000DAFC85A|nr:MULTISPECIES: hypothetical protein [Sphingobacterium]PZT97908.1 MAG: hypothetical protein DI622_22735 [Chryseobacterium sp.]
MKKTISIILNLIGILSVTSCRQDDATLNEPLKDTIQSNRPENLKTSDSTSISNFSELDEDITLGETGDGDPPPKKGGQWRNAD